MSSLLKFPDKQQKVKDIEARYITGIKVENLYLPEEIKKICPVSADVYNLFESRLPATGHLALLVSDVLASMCIDEPKPSSLTVSALPTEGKTATLVNFSQTKCISGIQRLEWVNWFTRTSFARYLLDYCGKYLDVTRTIGKELPAGARYENFGGKRILSISGCQDRIDRFFDIVHAGEGILTIDDVDKWLQLMNGLLDEGFWEGGDMHKGWYRIGSPQFRIRHGLIFACTTNDLETKLVKQIGTLSRTVTGTYYCNSRENEYIIQGRTPPNIRIKYADFSQSVSEILSHLNPKMLHDVTFNDEVNSKDTENILKLIKLGRDEATGKRAMNDRINLLKAHAFLNKRSVVKYEDVIMVESMLQMCRKLKNPSGNIYFFGDRLHFQICLRSLLYRNLQFVRDSMRETFKWWDSEEQLYKDSDVDNAYKALQLPM